jgi:hypothetical protein
MARRVLARRARVLGIVGPCCLAAVLIGAHRHMAVGPRGAAPAELVTRMGAPGRADAVVEHSLGMMHSYMSLGTASQLVRERVLSPELAAAMGRDGRALVANMLDHTEEVMAYARSPIYSREQFFRALGELNAMLASRGLGYYVYAAFQWDPSYRRVDQVMLEVFAITRVSSYRAGARTVRALHVRRAGAPRVHRGRLGFTAPEYPEIFILPDQIEQELMVGLWPARDPDASTRLFWVMDEDMSAVWYGELRRALAASMTQELDAMAASNQPAERLVALGAAFQRAVELHEIQHFLDFRARLPLRGLFKDLAERLGDRRLARSCMYETSAHLAQLARAPDAARSILGEIASYAFSDECLDAYCLAALVILDEIGAELGIAQSDSLIARKSYRLEDIAMRYVPIAGRASPDVSAAAGRAWERLFEAPLIAIELEVGR